MFTMLVPNCPLSYYGAKLSVCLFGAKLSVFTILVPYCPMPNCPDAKLSGAKLSYHQLDMNSHCPGEHPDGSWDLQNSVLVYLVLWLVCLMSLALDGVSVTFGTSKIYVIGICIAEI